MLARKQRACWLTFGKKHAWGEKQLFEQFLFGRRSSVVLKAFPKQKYGNKKLTIQGRMSLVDKNASAQAPKPYICYWIGNDVNLYFDHRMFCMVLCHKSAPWSPWGTRISGNWSRPASRSFRDRSSRPNPLDSPKLHDQVMQKKLTTTPYGPPYLQGTKRSYYDIIPIDPRTLPARSPNLPWLIQPPWEPLSSLYRLMQSLLQNCYKTNGSS